MAASSHCPCLGEMAESDRWEKGLEGWEVEQKAVEEKLYSGDQN
jgi:hypothetical protein